MAKRGLITSIIWVFLLSSFVGTMMLVSCSAGGHAAVMQAMGAVGCPTSFTQHLVKWQAAFSALVVGTVLFIIMLAYVRNMVGIAALVADFWTQVKFRLSNSLNMKFFDPLRIAIVSGIVDGKRFEDITQY